MKIMVEFGQVWSGLVGFGWVWSGLVRFGLVWSGFGRVWWGLVGFGEFGWGCNFISANKTFIILYQLKLNQKILY